MALVISIPIFILLFLKQSQNFNLIDSKDIDMLTCELLFDHADFIHKLIPTKASIFTLPSELVFPLLFVGETPRGIYVELVVNTLPQLFRWNNVFILMEHEKKAFF